MPVPATVPALVERFRVNEAAYRSGHYNETQVLSLIHIYEPTRLLIISYAVFCLNT